MRIHKYQLPTTQGTHTLKLPQNSVVLHTGNQYDALNVWVQEPDEFEKLEERVFRVVYTGEPFQISGRNLFYLGTVLINGGTLVLHVYEEQ